MTVCAIPTLGFPPEPPAAPEAEAMFLGCVLLLDDAADAAAAVDGLVEADFTVAAHLLVFQAVTAMVAVSMIPSAFNVLCELRRMGRVSSWPTPSGSVVFLAELVEIAPIPLGYCVARQALLEAAARRRLHEACLRLGDAAGTGVFEVLTRLVSDEALAVVDALQRVPA